MSLFGGQDNFDSPHSTFRTFGAALVTLTRCATVDSWENVLYAARAHSPYAPVYFLSFMVFGSMVMVNLFIAAVLVSPRGPGPVDSKSNLCSRGTSRGTSVF